MQRESILDAVEQKDHRVSPMLVSITGWDAIEDAWFHLPVANQNRNPSVDRRNGHELLSTIESLEYESHLLCRRVIIASIGSRSPTLDFFQRSGS